MLHMAYEIVWDTPGKVLRLNLHSNMTVEAFVEIDREINNQLRGCAERVVLIVDTSGAKVDPYSIRRIRTTQTYLDGYEIVRIVVLDEKKVNRLAMLLLFNLCRPKLQFCSDLDQARRFLEMSRS
jgi:hypothetical protein